MWVLLFYVAVGLNSIPVSEKSPGTFDSQKECTETGQRMVSQMNHPRVHFKCVNIVFKEVDK